MSCVKYLPASFSGSVTAPPSKSVAHRAILCAALARGNSVLRPLVISKDIEATIGAIEALGAKTEYDPNTQTLRVQGIETAASSATINCLESGSTLRFLIPVAASLGCKAMFIGQGRLPERPIGCYTECLPLHGIQCETTGGLPFPIHGKLQPGEFQVPGNISSQFITGLLFALPLLNGNSRIMLTTPLESAGYVELTIAVLKEFGIMIYPDEHGWYVPGNQRFLPQNYMVEGDWSQAAFFLAMGALTNDPAGISIHGLRTDSAQGDKSAVEIFRRFGAKIFQTDDGILVQPGTRLGIKVDVSNVPDLAPAIAACAAFCNGTTIIENAARLRIKESDRLAALENGLRALGADVHSTNDSLIITGHSTLPGGMADGCHDHRIVMALATCAARCTGEITVTDAQSIEKSYPNFFEDYNQLGGKAHVIHLG